MMSAERKVVTKINKAALRKGLVYLKKQKLEAVTISLLNSYQNGATRERFRKYYMKNWVLMLRLSAQRMSYQKLANTREPSRQAQMDS